MNEPANNYLRIGALARAAEVAVDTIRYYERRGLLPEPAREASGYRVYGDEAVRRLRFIRHAKQLGFTLSDIRELLRLSEDGRHGVAGVKARAESHLDAIQQRIAELERMRAALEELIAACPGCGALARCPILAALSGEQTQ